MNVYLYLMAGLTLGGAVSAMTLRSPVHCALCLVVTFVGLAGLYLEMGAQFLGLAQVLVYVGAVAILLVFVLLLTRGGGEDGEDAGRDGWGRSVVCGVLVAGTLLGALWTQPAPAPRNPAPASPSVQEMGQALMTDFVLPLQVVGVLLTASMIGAAIVALREPRGGGRR